jgi:hypothetical protein
MNIPAPKIEALHQAPKAVSKTALTILITFQLFMETVSLNRTAESISSGK